MSEEFDTVDRNIFGVLRVVIKGAVLGVPLSILSLPAGCDVRPVVEGRSIVTNNLL